MTLNGLLSNRRRRMQNRYPIGALVLGTMCAASYGQMMSIDQSVSFLKERPIDTPEIDWRRRWWTFNSEAKDQCWAALVDDSKKELWFMAATAIGYTGDKSDVEKIKTYIAKLNGQLNPRCYETLRAFIEYSLAVLYYRNVPEAGDSLREMLKPNYWKNAKFETAFKRPVAYPSLQAEMACSALRGLSYSRKLTDAEIDSAIREVLANLTPQDAKQLKEFGWVDSNRFKRRLVEP